MKTGISYFHTRDPRHVERDLDDIVEHGCNFIVHCYSETDMAFYNQAVEKIIRLSKDRGLEVYLDPWGLGGLYGGETFSKFVAENLAARQISVNGQSLPAACPNSPDFISFQAQWTQRAADLGADICFWDEPHYHFNFMDPSSWDNWACRCDVCRKLYKDEYNEDMPGELTSQVVQFRQQSLLRFLDKNCKDAKELGMRNCVCVLPDEGGEMMGQAAGTAAWEEIAGLSDIDIFGTDPYWALFGGDVDEYVRKHCSRVKQLCDKYEKEAQAWVLAFILPEDREEEVTQAIDVMVETGIRNIAAWGYLGCHLIDIKCARPELVWEILGKSFNKIKDR
ncbi:MAG: hypothetical protein JRJ19_16020 [Deltaproteobacteria bacterium]|nr:hypothetical protein [Deltaproteobacteria bacterium]MBW1873574.1 hypothetical protein [Deltaproteobacteria bacterium]